MAYARPGEFGSDVYVLRTGTDLVCHDDDKPFVTSSEQAMLDHLDFHRRMGDKVPERALERLRAERDGIAYETDVERAMRNLREGGVL